ncbi:MAG: S1C family serine protease [Planctomycetota bacterium]
MNLSSSFARSCAATMLACALVVMVGDHVSAQPSGPSPGAQPPISGDARDVQRRVAKVYGAGGIRSLEAYQSGFLVSPEGHIATAWSYVLDVEPIVILDDGRRFESEIIGIEPTLGIAVLKIDASDLPFFKLDEEQAVRWGDPIVAVSNLFGIAAGDESASVMQGTVAAVTNLKARRGTYKTPYQGEVLILDLIANNPGAAGGAVADASGRLVGMLGKELRDDATGVWLNYALPISALKKTIGDIVAGRTTTVPKNDTPNLKRDQAHSLATLGLILVPNILEKTPVYVDAVKPESPAAKASLRPDDLILLVDGQRVADQRGLLSLLRKIDRRDAVSLTIQRDTEVLPVRLQP